MSTTPPPSYETCTICCPNCGNGERLQFLPLAFSTWTQCTCGYGWDLPNSNVSRMVN